jgi:hypothetical protein
MHKAEPPAIVFVMTATDSTGTGAMSHHSAFRFLTEGATLFHNRSDKSK